MSDADISEKFISSNDHLTIAKKLIVKPVYDIYLGKNVDQDDCYHELFYFLDREVTSKDQVNLHMANYGGSCHLGVAIINHIQNSTAIINLVVDAPCYSMGALIAVAGDSLEMKNNTFLMFHNYSAVTHGKGKELLDGVIKEDYWLKEFFIDVASPFLTKSEFKQLFNDNDVYVNWDSSGLENRIKRHFK